jgi:hypothetical protein
VRDNFGDAKYFLLTLYPVAIVIQSLYAQRIYLISKKRWLAAIIICVSRWLAFFIELSDYVDTLIDVTVSIC